MKPRRTRNASRKDANHNELVARWRAMGGSWQDTHQIAGALDGIAGCFGLDVRIEIKNLLAERGKAQAGRLTSAERETVEAWRGRPPEVWTCPEDVEATRARLLQEHRELNGAL